MKVRLDREFLELIPENDEDIYKLRRMFDDMVVLTGNGVNKSEGDWNMDNVNHMQFKIYKGRF